MAKHRAWNSTLPAPTKPMNRGGGPKNRGGSRFPGRRQPHYRKWYDRQGLVCLITGNPEPHPCHVQPKGNQGPDMFNIVPLVWNLHDEQEKATARFDKNHNINLYAEARTITEEYLKRIFLTEQCALEGLDPLGCAGPVDHWMCQRHDLIWQADPKMFVIHFGQEFGRIGSHKTDGAA